MLDQWESAIGNPSSDMDNGIVHHLIHTRDLDELNRQLTRIATAGTRHEGDHR